MLDTKWPKDSKKQWSPPNRTPSTITRFLWPFWNKRLTFPFNSSLIFCAHTLSRGVYIVVYFEDGAIDVAKQRLRMLMLSIDAGYLTDTIIKAMANIFTVSIIGVDKYFFKSNALGFMKWYAYREAESIKIYLQNLCFHPRIIVPVW